jgi:hypothetical protein
MYYEGSEVILYIYICIIHININGSFFQARNKNKGIKKAKC